MTAETGRSTLSARQQGPCRELAGHIVAPIVGDGTGLRRTTNILLSATLCWGIFASGAFFAEDRLVFTILAVLTLLSAWSVIDRREVRWWILTLAPGCGAVVTSGLVHHAVADLPLAIAPFIASAALGLAASIASRGRDQALLQRVVVDVATVLGLLCWIGVSWHLAPFAAHLNQGWRGEAGIGYANVTGAVLALGAVIATRLAAASNHPADLVRCTVLMTAMASTQSRTLAVAALVAWGVMAWRQARIAGVLLHVAVPAAVATAGLIPSIRSNEARPIEAIVAAAIAGLLLLLARTRWRSLGRMRATAKIVSIAAALSCGVLLRERLLDIGSVTGHWTLWQSSLEKAWQSGFFGQGPREPAKLSRGDAVLVLAHNDILQLAAYYGLPALVAGLWLIGRVVYGASEKFESSRRVRLISPVTSAALLVVVVTGLTDFPLQIPVVPAALALVIGIERSRAARPVSAGRAAPACSVPPENRSSDEEAIH
ncbi:hypothetical protein PV458_25720 [Streptomyces sp. MN03-5084-2B]|nr:hypothetical protein [Streptomyces sp. MN03-5084-2B]